MTRKLTAEERTKLWTFVDNADMNGSAFPGMSYEDGIRAVLEILDGDSTADDAVGE